MEEWVSNASYFASVGVQNQEGILGESQLQRYSGKLNISQEAIKGRLKVDYQLTASRIENLRPDNSAIVVDMLELNPTIPVFTNGEPTLLDNSLNPIVRNDIRTDETISNRILASIAPSIEIIKGLRYKLNLGVDYASTTRDEQWLPYNLLEGFENGSLTTGITENTNFLIENTLSYDFKVNDHSINILAGHGYQEFENVMVEAFSMSGFVDEIEPRFQDQISGDNSGGVDLRTTVGAVAEKDELQSFFGRVNYSYKGKYLVTATIRADGSSRFGQNNEYGYFPSFAFGWNITEEDFLTVPWINSLKLRASWGQTGNQDLAPKSTLQRFTESRSNNDTYPLDPNASGLDDYPFGIIPVNQANPDLQWEVSTQTDFGIDFDLFNYRLSGSIGLLSKSI